MEGLLDYFKGRQKYYKQMAFKHSKLCDYYLGKADGIESVLIHLEKELPYSYRKGV